MNIRESGMRNEVGNAVLGLITDLYPRKPTRGELLELLPDIQSICLSYGYSGSASVALEELERQSDGLALVEAEKKAVEKAYGTLEVPEQSSTSWYIGLLLVACVAGVVYSLV